MPQASIDLAIRFLNRHNIPFERHDHAAVFTVDQVSELVSIDRGARTKNLFVRDKRGRRHVLIVVPFDVSVDLMKLGELLQLGRLSFASETRLFNYLGVEPGSVTLLGVINDSEQQVEVVIDERIWAAEFVRCHPLHNTSTLVIGNAGLKSIFEATGHQPHVLMVPTL